MKQLTIDPWLKAVEKYKVGQVVKGKVLKINPFGAFVELDKDIHGLAHISELSDKPMNNPGEIIKVDNDYQFKILSIEAKNHRLGLSIKALTEPSKKQSAEPKPKQAATEVPPEPGATPEEPKPEDSTKDKPGPDQPETNP